MKNNTFSILETMEIAWHLVGGSKFIFFTIMILISIVQCAPLLLFIPKIFFVDVGWINSLINIIQLIAAIILVILSWGLILIGGRIAFDGKASFEMIGEVFHLELFFKMVGLWLLTFLIFLPIVLISYLFYDFVPNFFLEQIYFVCATILSLHLIMRLYVAQLIVILEKSNPWIAIKKSFFLTRSKTWKLFILSIINIFIIAISLIPFGIGLLWSIPYIYINYGMIYKKLSGL